MPAWRPEAPIDQWLLLTTSWLQSQKNALAQLLPPSAHLKQPHRWPDHPAGVSFPDQKHWHGQILGRPRPQAW